MMKTVVETLLHSAPMQEAFQYLETDDRHTLEQQLELVQIPAYSNQEEERAKRFQKMIEEIGYETEMDEVGNVYTRIPGSGEGPTVYLSAHMDTVFPPETPLELTWDGNKICVPGIADDTRGMAEVLTMLRTMKKVGLKPVGDLIIGGNVGEEALGNLRGVKHFFGKHADEIDGFVSLDAVGCLICYGGTGSHRYKVTFRGPGGHSYNAFGVVNPIHAMGRAISYLSEVRTPKDPKTTFSVGVVEGGTSVNAIASQCSMQVDMRADGVAELEELDAKFRECLKRAVEDENARWVQERTYEQSGIVQFDREARIELEITPIGDRPVGSQPEDCEIVNIWAGAYRLMGEEPVYMSNGSTDANVPISLGIPAVCICGGGTAGLNHSVKEWFDPTDAYKGPQRNLLALFAMVGLTDVCGPCLGKRDR
ncbi:MAG: M20/M25/M40 family metallo-hydrolase [Lachnospiraceae bacterium]|nr:M20/M25/M40 family metallo-hydrolase [Lachnospiraceae bacterium]